MKRKLSSSALFAAAVGLMLFSAALSRMVEATSGPLGYALTTVSVAAVVASVVAVFLHWRRLDEAAREAHKAAWYWGGSGGLAVAGFGAGYLTANPDADLFRYALFPGDAGLFVSGALYTVLVQIVGYVVVWAWWWWSRR